MKKKQKKIEIIAILIILSNANDKKCEPNETNILFRYNPWLVSSDTILYSTFKLDTLLQ